MTTLFILQVTTGIDELGRYTTLLTQEVCTSITDFEEDILKAIIKRISKTKKGIQTIVKDFSISVIEGYDLVNIIDVANKISETPFITPVTAINEDNTYRVEIIH
jgi:hypothetical protein